MQNQSRGILSSARIGFCALLIACSFSQVSFGQSCTLNAVNAGNDVTICNGATTQLTATKTGGGSGVTYSWVPTTGLSNPNISNPVANPTTTTAYTVTATEGTCIVSDQIIVTVNVIDYSFTNNQCSGTQVQFTSSVTGAGTFSYTWEFGDATTSTQQNPSHSFTANPGTGTQTFNVKLTVTNTTTTCVQSITKSVGIKQPPDATINSNATSDYFNGEPIFKTCSTSSAIVTFTNPSSTANVNYVIDWGDGTPNFSTTSWNSTTHPYAVGFWNLTYSITGQNGCAVTKTYKVFVGSNPEVSFGTPGSTDNCSPSPLTFPITGTSNNPVGTTYTVTFNDGSPAEVFNHPPPSSITHIFLKSSCGIISSDGSNTYPNSFSGNIVARNPCGLSSVGVVPIYVSTSPVANYTLSTPTPVTCVNTPVCLTNSSTGSVTITNSGSSCNAVPKIVWIITPSAGITLTSGSLGNDFGSSSANAWLTGSNAICPSFSLPGTYSIKMKVGNRCGSDSIVKTICVESPLVPQFTLSLSSGCAPLSVTTTNLTDLSDTCTTPAYLWEVSYAATNCGSIRAYTLTNSTSPNPSFQFTNPGTYTLKLSVTNSCGTHSTTKDVIVTKPPTVTISNILTVCQTFPSTVIHPTANITNCGLQPLTYAWSFPGGIPATSSSEDPGSITYRLPGVYSVSLIVTNECGPATTTSNSFTIKPTPTVNDISNQEKCKGEQSDAVVFSGTVLNTLYSWTNNNTLIGLPASGTGDINPITLTNTGTTVLTATINVTPSLNGCIGTSKSFTIKVNPAPTVNTITNKLVCNGATQSSVNFSSTVTGTTFSWTNNNAGIGLASSGTGNTPDFTAVNSGTTPIVATISVTPLNALGGCPGTVRTFTITVNPTPAPMVLDNKEFCNGVLSPSIIFSNAVAGTTYAWTNSNTSIGLAASGTGSVPSFI